IKMLRTAFTLLSLSLLIASSLFWMRSHRHNDNIQFMHRHARWELASRNGIVLLGNQPQLDFESQQFAAYVIAQIHAVEKIFDQSNELYSKATGRGPESSDERKELRRQKDEKRKIVRKMLADLKYREHTRITTAKVEHSLPWMALWPVLSLPMLLPTKWAVAWMRRRRRLRNGQCVACGYDLRASTSRCQECGLECTAETAVSRPAL
ncbi:MAG TPA: hypothetical protein VFE47_17345, partial [Tepidisphaeraceae bacterium]|nr:hypothetical protein [Tepidisphaeraceae bacterium]